MKKKHKKRIAMLERTANELRDSVRRILIRINNTDDKIVDLNWRFDELQPKFPEPDEAGIREVLRSRT